MLDDGAGGAMTREFTHQFKSSVRIVDIIVAQFFALMLDRCRHTGPRGPVGIERSLLMRIFAVSQALSQCAAKAAAAGRFANSVCHPCADGRVIGGCPRIGDLG